MPDRVSVRIYSYLKRDTFAVPMVVMAERRPVKRSPQRSGDAESPGNSHEYVFWTADLNGLVLKEGDRIKDVSLFVSIDSIDERLMGQRLHCICSPSTDPNAVI